MRADSTSIQSIAISSPTMNYEIIHVMRIDEVSNYIHVEGESCGGRSLPLYIPVDSQGYV